MSQPPLVSVCIPSYNYARFIGETIESVIAQTYPHWEIVIVDDASADESVQVIQKYADRFPDRIRFEVNDRNMGPSVTANRVIDNCRGRYVAPIAADDRMLPERLERQVRYLEMHANHMAVFTSVQLIDDAGAPLNNLTNWFDKPFEDVRWKLLHGNFLCATSVLLRREAFDLVGRMNPALLHVQDFDYWLRLLDRHEIHRLEENLTEYRVHGKNLSVDLGGSYFGAHYESVVSILRALERWPLTHLFDLGDEDSPDRAMREADACCVLAKHLLALDHLYFQRPFMCTSAAYAYVLKALERVPDHGEARVVSDFVHQVLGDATRPEDKKGVLFRAWLESHPPAREAWYLKWHGVRTGTSIPARKRVLVYSIDVKSAACAQIRLVRPFRELHGGWELVWAAEAGKDGKGVWDESLLQNADLVIIQRAFPGRETASLVDLIFASGKPVIYEADDLFLEVPKDNVHAQEVEARLPFIRDAIRRAHGVVTSTQELAGRLKTLNARIQVLPNLVDYGLFHRSVPENGRTINIGVIGTSTRGADFALIDAPLRTACKAYGKRLRIKFIGNLPEAWRDHPNAEHVPFTPDYGAYAARLKSLDLDIGLAPLTRNAFNDCKSPIKWLELSALGAAGIFSNVPAYAGVVEQGVTGLLVDAHPDKWLTALKLLIDYPQTRLEIVLSAQLKVLQEFSLQRHAQLVHETYARLLEQLGGEKGEAARAGHQEATSTEPDYYALWQLGHGYQEWDLHWMAERMTRWSAPPAIRIGVICRGGSEDLLANNIKSLSQQFHKAWHLAVVAEVEAPQGLDDIAGVTWIQAPPERAIPALNEALAAGTETWVGMMEAGDRLPLHATFTVADAALRHPEWRMLYSDEDRLAHDGERHTPFFKTDFNLDMLRAAPFSLGGLLLLQRGFFAELGGFRPEAEGVESWDLALRASEFLNDDQVGHLADVLYHRHEAGGHCLRDPADVWRTARDCLAGHLERKGLPADIEDGLLPGSFRIRYQVRATPLVSIIVPTKNKVDLLRNCLTSLIEGTRYSHCEVLVVDNGSDEPETLAYLQALRELGSNSLRVLSFPGPFNFSAMNNMAAREARGAFLLLLNNDTQVLHEDWLDEMLGYAQRDDVGAVGARLLYPDGTVQHAGAVLGLGGMGSNHVFRRAVPDDPGYFGRLMLPQGYSAVTAACLLTRRDHYQAVGGLDEEVFQVNFNDVDYCLKLRERGLKVVWTPYATLRHEESVSQVAQDVEQLAQEEKYKRLYREVEAVVDKWPRWFANDPAYNRNLSLMLPFEPETTPALTWDPEWRPAPRILSIHADTMGCGEYRIIAPMRALKRAGKVMGWDAASYFQPREYARMDPASVVFQRQVKWGQIEFMQRIARISKAFRIYELDDLITNIPIMSSQKKLFVEQKDVVKRFRKAVSLCHRFVVSTDYLAQAFKGYCDEIVVVPNYLERARWDGFTPMLRRGGKARVGWAGSATHAGDLRLIIDVVKATASEVDWIFFGMCPDEIRPLVKEYHDPVKLEDYAAKLASLDLDLAIAPLEDIPFNHGKSHLRLLEYGVLGYPVICTDITPYRGGYPVTRVSNKFKAWVEAIRSHVAEPEALARQGEAMREHVQKNWMLEDHLDIWLKAWLPS